MEEHIVRRVGRRVMRLQSIEEGTVRYLHLEDPWDYAEGEIIGIQVARRWRLGGSRHIMGVIVRTRVDLDYLHLDPRPLEEQEDGQFAFQTIPIDRILSRLIDNAADQIRMGRCERAADFLTLTSSAVRNDLDVWAYVKAVLDQLLAGSTDYESLRPDIWKKSHGESIRVYRTKERRDRADRKQLRRTRRRAPR